MNDKTDKNISARATVPLSFVVKGTEVVIVEIGADVEDMQKQRLASYGLVPKRKFTVLRQKPMTIVLADELEIAVERQIARDIWVSLK